MYIHTLAHTSLNTGYTSIIPFTLGLFVVTYIARHMFYGVMRGHEGPGTMLVSPIMTILGMSSVA